jgi:hypothetical protein
MSNKIRKKDIMDHIITEQDRFSNGPLPEGDAPEFIEYNVNDTEMEVQNFDAYLRVQKAGVTVS